MAAGTHPLIAELLDLANAVTKPDVIDGYFG
jgi:hypothetical protein